MKLSALICAAGSGKRMGAGKNKVYLELCGKPVLYYSLNVFESSAVSDIVVVTGKGDIDECRRIVGEYGFKKVTRIVAGGDTRQESVYRGLCECSGDIVAIHDGARALITVSEIAAVIADCLNYGAAALGTVCKDTVKTVSEDGYIEATLDRDRTYCIATPQVFALEDIMKAHKSAAEDGFFATDDCALYERMGGRIKITEGSYENIKLTTPEDMLIAEKILNKRGKVYENRSWL